VTTSNNWDNGKREYSTLKCQLPDRPHLLLCAVLAARRSPLVVYPCEYLQIHSRDHECVIASVGPRLRRVERGAREMKNDKMNDVRGADMGVLDVCQCVQCVGRTGTPPRPAALVL